MVLQFEDILRQGDTTWKEEEGEEEDGGCLTTITTKELSFQNKTIYEYKTVTGTGLFKNTHEPSTLWLFQTKMLGL